MVFNTWFGLAVPAATPQPIVDKLNAALNVAMKSPEVGKRITDMGAEVQTSTPEQFGTFWGKELQRYKELIKLSGATLE
jgi:tripartite-type tricarboxylate transporter receptor subunit TctC